MNLFLAFSSLILFASAMKSLLLAAGLYRLPFLSILGKNVVSLSTSKSPPDLATISVGSMIKLPAAGSKNSYTSMNSIELRPCTGIRTAAIVIFFLLSSVFNHSSFLIIWLSLCLVSIGLPSMCFRFSKFLKSPCRAIPTFIADVGFSKVVPFGFLPLTKASRYSSSILNTYLFIGVKY